MPTVAEILKNPDFLQQDSGFQERILMTADPSFAALTPESRQQALLRINAQGGAVSQVKIDPRMSPADQAAARQMAAQVTATPGAAAAAKAALANGPNSLTQRTDKALAAPRPPEGFIGTLGHEFYGGLDEIAAANAEAKKQNLSPGGMLKSPFSGPMGNAIAGGLRAAGSPFTAAGRAAGQKVQDWTLPTLGEPISSGLGTATDMAVNLLSPTVISKAGQAIRAIPQFGKAAKIAELSKPILVPETPDMITAAAEASKANLKTAEAMKGVVRTQQAIPNLPPDLAMAEQELSKATTATRQAALADIAARQQAAALAQQAGQAIPSLPQAQQAAATLSPVSKSVVDAGKFGVESFKKQKAIAEEPFKAFYSNIEKAYPGKMFEPKNALAAKAKVSGIAEPIEQGLATRSERIAAQPIGGVGGVGVNVNALSEDAIAKLMMENFTGTAREELMKASPAQRRSMIQSAIGSASTVRTDAMTIQDMIVARRRMGASARTAMKLGDGATASEFQAMKNAYLQDITAVNPKLAELLVQIDRKYAQEFIPKYGFDSVAGKAVENAGAGEGLMPSIFKSFTPKTKDDLITIKSAKAAYTPEQFGVLSRSFVEDLISRSNVDGVFDPRKFRVAIKQYRPETLIEGLGNHGYSNLKQFADEMDAARRLQRQASTAEKAAKVAGTEGEETYAKQQAAAKRSVTLSNERTTLLTDKMKAAEKSAKDALTKEGAHSDRYQALEKARLGSEKKLNAERLDQLHKLESRGVLHWAQTGFERAGRLAGPASFIHGVMQGDPSWMLRGGLLTMAGPMIADIILTDRTGKILRGMGGIAAGTPLAAAKAAQVNAILNTVKKEEPKPAIP